MPTCGGPVYQPTTVSYEPRSVNGNGTGEGFGYLSPSITRLRVLTSRKCQLGILIFAILALVIGILFLAFGAYSFIRQQEYARQHKLQVPTSDDSHPKSDLPSEVVYSCSRSLFRSLSVGISFTFMGVIALGIYLALAGWRRACVCPCPCPFFDKKQSLARQLQCQNVDGGCGQGIMALNPSTDPLVSHTQYAPVSELPSLRVDEEERRNLMPDNKDCLSSAEESDRMLEPDPRIVLRPVGRVEDA